MATAQRNENHAQLFSSLIMYKFYLYFIHIFKLIVSPSNVEISIILRHKIVVENLN